MYHDSQSDPCDSFRELAIDSPPPPWLETEPTNAASPSDWPSQSLPGMGGLVEQRFLSKCHWPLTLDVEANAQYKHELTANKTSVARNSICPGSKEVSQILGTRRTAIRTTHSSAKSTPSLNARAAGHHAPTTI